MSVSRPTGGAARPADRSGCPACPPRQGTRNTNTTILTTGFVMLIRNINKGTRTEAAVRLAFLVRGNGILKRE
eukprot:774074-Prorocentrum_minimum.AAC.1